MKTSTTLKLLTTLIAVWLYSVPTVVAQPLCQAGFQFTLGQTTPNGTQVNLYDSSFAAGTITNWSWSYGNGTGSTLQNPVTSFMPGTYYVCLTITAMFQNQSCTSQYCDTIVIPGTQACDPSFSYTNNVLGTQFAATGSNNTSWSWDFGDGSTSNAQNPLHTYNSNGTYTVCLTVTNASGVSCTSCQTITIGTSGGCQAYFSAIQTPGTIIYNFTDMSLGNVTNFFWTFGDNTSSTLQNPTHTYSSPGIYTVCLTITDSIAGCTDTYCDSLFVQVNTSCNANFGYQTSPIAGTVFNAVTTNNVSWVWDFGDGSTGTGAFITHVYAPGTYNACLTVTTANGQTCTSCQTITIQGNTNCSSNFAIYPDTTTLHSYFAYNLASGVGPLSYVWSWGDGTSSNTAYPSHTYASAGLYTICLSITDATGCTSNTCYQFQLLRIGSGVPVTINVIAGSTGFNENDLVNSLVVSPNPATEYVKANFTLSNDTDLRYSVKNIAGQSVYNSSSVSYSAGSHEIKVDVSGYPSGLYLFEIVAGDSRKFTKILVQ